MSEGSVAILGWGSLIWDSRPDFESQIGAWTKGGPVLPVEFCRISDSRKGALTLVIDRKLGTEVETLYAFSRRSDPGDAVCDLRSREGTNLQNIGLVDLKSGEQRSRDPEVAKIIKEWARQRSIQVVVWTDLESNFCREKSIGFSFDTALDHLKGLSADGVREAVKYIVRTPQEVSTGFRQWLGNVEWFKEQSHCSKATHDSAIPTSRLAGE